MKILLMQSYLGRKEAAVLPLGLASLAGYLQAHEVRVLDPNVEEAPFEAIERKLDTFRPEVVGISLRNIDTTVYKDRFFYYKTLAPTIEIINKTVPGAVIVAGGAAFSLYAEEIMRRNPRIDFGVHLEGEETFPHLLENLANPEHVQGVYYRHDGRVLFSGERALFDFSNARTPRWDLFQLSKYANTIGIGLQSKRGCCLRCAYCTYPFLTGHKTRRRPVRKVVDELEHINRRPGVPVLFADPVFNLPKRHAEQICEEIIARDIKVKWSAYFSLKGVDADFIRLAHRAGCYLFLFSPDAYSDKAINILQKESGKKEIRRIYNMVKKLKIKDARFDFSFFINAPGQNYLDLLRILWLVFRTNFLLPRKRFMHISVNVPRLEPHTALYRLAVQEGSLSAGADLLPVNESALSRLFYHNKNVRLAEDILNTLIRMKMLLKPRFGGG